MEDRKEKKDKEEEEDEGEAGDKRVGVRGECVKG